MWCQRCDMLLGLRAVTRSKEETAVTRFAQNLRTDLYECVRRAKTVHDGTNKKIISSLNRLTRIRASLTAQI